MQIVGIIVTGFISLLIGVLGFPQIIGCIKYFYLRTPAKNFGTIFVWVIVLGIIGIIAHVFFIDYIAGYYAGTIIAFIRSFSVEPDENLINPPQEEAEEIFVSSIQIPDDAPNELRELYRKQQIAEKGIWIARKTITQLYDDLDASPSEEQMKSAYESGLVTKEKYNEYLELRRSVNLHIQAQKNAITMIGESFNKLQKEIDQYKSTRSNSNSLPSQRSNSEDDELSSLYKKLNSIQSAIHLIEEEKGKATISVMTSEEALAAWNDGRISNDQLKEYIAKKDKLPDEMRKYEITLEALQAQKQDVLNKIQAIESTNQSAPVLVQTSFVSPDESEQPAYTTHEVKGSGLSQKAKAIIILCVAAVLIIVIAAVASNSRNEKKAANSTQPVIGQTVYWNRQKYHSRPDCPMIYRESVILEKEYTQNVDDSELCSWCWEHQNDD